MFKDQYLPADAPASITLTPITNPVEITAIMEADAAKDDKPTNPTPEPHPTAAKPAPEPSAPDGIAALSYLLRFLTPHIERMVEKKFAALVQNHNTLTHMDENLESRMMEIANTAVENHEQDNAHETEDALSDLINTILEDRGVSKRELRETISDMVDEKVGEAIENHEHETNHIEEWEIDDKLENFISTDNIEEYMVEALKKVEFKINVTEKE